MPTFAISQQAREWDEDPVESGLSMPQRLAQLGYDAWRDAYRRNLPRRSRETGGGGVTDIVILSKRPPGGRCSLYLRYAESPHE